MMNQALAVINDNMVAAMKDTVEMTLALNLAPQPENISGNSASEAVKRILADYQYFYQAPMSTNPYDTDVENNGYFSPLYNTEPHEQLFLAMGNSRSDHTLRSFFVNSAQNESPKARGLDQWFIRGGAHADYSETFRYTPNDPNGSYIGGEATPGIMRVYKSANLNETNAGLLGGALTKVDRGNHIITTEGTIPRFSFSFTIFYGLIDVGKIFSDILNDFLGRLMPENFFDVAPSAGNKKSFIPYMCREVEDSIALYSEYRWSSAKWFCKWDLKWKPKWRRPKVRWREHIGLPKLFCGENHSLASLANFNISDSAMEILEKIMQFFPPYFSPIGTVLPEADDLPEGYYGRNHGYMEGAWTLLSLHGAFPYEQLLPGEHSYSRKKYRPCAMMLDSFQMPFIQGHARIYGDDREIFDENYIGAHCRPWVINEKFFTGSGTVVVGAAKKLNNPFAAIFNVDAITEGLFQIFNPNNANDSSDASRPTWAIAAARAAVKDPNYGARGYKLHFEDMFLYKKQPGLYTKHKDITEEADDGAEYSKDHQLDADLWLPAGCICHEDNRDKITKNWNLCETDWEPVLIPLRYRGNKPIIISGSGTEKVQYNNNTGFIGSDNFFNKSMWTQFDPGSANQSWSPDFNTFSPDGKSGSLNLDALFDYNKIY